MRAQWPFDPAHDLPLRTPDLAGIGGMIKQRPEDFLVEEIPLYDPCGSGEHCYLLVEKRGLATTEMLDIVREHFGVRSDAIGYAGMKDKVAITRQVVSIHTPGKTIDDFPMLEHPRLAVLWADMHDNKLRVGHLRGNRFSIRVRGVQSTEVVRAQRILMELARIGAPNYYGEQRFGARCNNHLFARADLLQDHAGALTMLLAPDPRYPEINPHFHEACAQGEWERAANSASDTMPSERAVVKALARGVPPHKVLTRVQSVQRKFAFTAFQSALFNRVVVQRMNEGLLDTLLEGDLAQKHTNGAVFRVGPNEIGTPDAAAELHSRLDSLEISPSAPIWGPKTMRPSGETLRIEEDALREAGVTVDAIGAHARRLRTHFDGTRRPARAPVIDPEVEGGVDEHGHYVRCAFELPKGSFATVVMREIMKDGPAETPGTVFAHAKAGHTIGAPAAHAPRNRHDDEHDRDA